MSLENEVEKESTIELPHPINLLESRQILSYLARNLPANIFYTYSCNVRLIHVSKKNSDTLMRKTELTKVGVSVQSLKEGISFGSFNLEPTHMNASGLLQRIKFNTTPGYDHLSDYRPETINLWREVRRLTDEYFTPIFKHKSSSII